MISKCVTDFRLPLAALIALAVTPSVHAADDGEVVFQSHCMRCHAPAEMSGRLTSTWVGRSADDLYQRIKTTMPAESPGSRSDDEYISVTAYILAQADMAPSMLNSDTAQLARVVAVRRQVRGRR